MNQMLLTKVSHQDKLPIVFGTDLYEIPKCNSVNYKVSIIIQSRSDLRIYNLQKLID